jgi:hypothetical protein
MLRREQFKKSSFRQSLDLISVLKATGSGQLQANRAVTVWRSNVYLCTQFDQIVPRWQHSWNNSQEERTQKKSHPY